MTNQCVMAENPECAAFAKQCRSSIMMMDKTERSKRRIHLRSSAHVDCWLVVPVVVDGRRGETRQKKRGWKGFERL